MKNIKKSTLKKCLPLIIIFIWSITVSPFLINDFSFKFLKTAKYWAGIVPLLCLFPIFLIGIIQEDNISKDK